MDASIRFHDGVNMSDVIRQTAASKSRIMTFDSSGHTIFPATHATMYRYLPINKEAAVEAMMHGAGALHIMLTQQV